MDNLENINWSTEEVLLNKFINDYSLPQIVKITSGYDDGTNENSISNGDILKLHSLTKEWKILCRNKQGTDLVIPIREQMIQKKAPCAGEFFQRVSDLARVKPLPERVAVSFGYSHKHSNGKEVLFKSGDILDLVCVNNTSKLSFKNISVTFRNRKGNLFKVPHDCAAGFTIQEDCRRQSLMNEIPDESFSPTFPFEFTFVDQKGQRLGLLTASGVREDHLIVASYGDEKAELLFVISQKIPVTVQVAVGTQMYDPDYECVKTLFRNYQSLESDLKSSKTYQDLEYCTREVNVYSVMLPKVPPRQQNSTDGVSDGISVTEAASSKSLRPIPPSRKPAHFPNDPPQIPPKDLIQRKPQGESSPIIQRNIISIENDKMEKSLRKRPPISPKPSPVIDSSCNNDSEYSYIEEKFPGGETCVENSTPNTKKEISKNVHENIYESLDNTEKKSSIYEMLNMDVPAIEENDRGVSIEEIKKMNIESFIQVLRLLHMEQHVKNFVDNQVNGSLFCDLDEDELKDLGLSKFEIKKLLRFKNGWRPT